MRVARGLLTTELQGSEQQTSKENKVKIKSMGASIRGVALTLLGGVVAAGDRTIHVAMAVVCNEFFLMVLTIAAFIVLLKG